MTLERDEALVAEARSGDREAFARLYAAYFDAVYDFLVRLVRDRDEAADLAQETFLKAMNGIEGLKQGTSFKAWLFTIARNSALNRLERARRLRPLAVRGEDGEEEPLDVVDPSRFADPQEAAEARAAAALVWEAAAGLDPRQLSILDLHLRQGLDGAEIAEVLGITRNNAYVLLHRLKAAVEAAISAFVLVREARDRCPELAALVAEAAAPGMTPELRKAVDRHTSRCDACGERRRRLAPLAVFAGLAPVGAPLPLREQVLGRLEAGAGSREQGAGSREPRAPAQGTGGGEPGAGMWRWGMGLGAAAAVLAGLLFLPFSPVSLLRGDGGDGLRLGSPGEPPDPTAPGVIVLTPSPGPGGTATATAAGSPTASASPGASPTGSPTGAATGGGPGGGGTPTPAGSTPTPGAGTATPTPSPTSSPTATATPVGSPTPCAAAVSVSPAGLVVGAGQQGLFTVANAGGCAAEVSLAWGAAWLVGGPVALTVPAGGQASVTFRVDGSVLPAGEGDYPATVTVTGPANTATVAVTGRRGGSPPQFVAAGASCSAVTGSTTFTATVLDDVGVVSVVGQFEQDGGGTVTVVLSPLPGGNWSGSTPAGGYGGSGFRLTATDGAGNETTVNVTPVGCSGRP
ncbi:RNA polymerase sigma factor [Tepidiforma sp.]|uniref:RNA polymerase sigma factor n=1 Tax=Tepidiforma sp. TaxID=2682230 RepID=UPI002ADE088E|nr:RNA polymerase sigma factor [Tepidiforma sp.]